MAQQNIMKGGAEGVQGGAAARPPATVDGNGVSPRRAPFERGWWRGPRREITLISA